MRLEAKRGRTGKRVFSIASVFASLSELDVDDVEELSIGFLMKLQVLRNFPDKCLKVVLTVER